MRTDRETLQLMAVWLEQGRTALPDHVLDAVLEQLPSKPQRRRWSPARRIVSMNPIAKFAIAAAAVVAIAIVGINLFGTASSGGVGGVAPSPLASPSAAPSSGSYRLAPSSGAIEPGRYRWLTDNAQVLFVLPDGWTAEEGGIFKNEDTAAEAGLGRMDGPIRKVYSDACFSAGALEQIGDSAAELVAALDAQRSTDADVRDVAAGSVTGQRVGINASPGLDPSQCRHGGEPVVPLQIWAVTDEVGLFAIPTDGKAVVYVFDVDGEPFVFTAALGPEADVAEVDAIVETFQFTRH